MLEGVKSFMQRWKAAGGPDFHAPRWLRWLTLGGDNYRTTLERFSGIVYSCIQVRAEALAGLNWRAQRKAADGSLSPIEEGHWLPRLMAQPSPLPWVTWDTINQQVEQCQSLFGAAILWTPTMGTGAPAQCWILPPMLVQPIAGDGARITVFRLTLPSGGAMDIPAEEVCYLPLTSVGDTMQDTLYLGRSRVSAALDEIDVGYYAGQYLRRHFERNALPEVLFESDFDGNKADKATFTKAFLQRYQGVRSTPEPMFMPNGTKATVLDTSANAKSMLQMSAQMRTSIASVFRVPMGMLTGEFNAAAPAASYHALRFTFYDSGIAPTAGMIGAVLTRHFQQYDPTVVYDHEPIEWKDPDEVRKDELHRLATGRATVNDLRRENGEKEVEGGDVVMIATNAYTPLLAPTPASPQPEEAAATLALPTRALSLVKAADLTEDERVKAWKEFDAFRAEGASSLLSAVRKGLRLMEKRVLSAVRSAPTKDAPELWNDDAILAEWLAGVEPEVRALAELSSAEAFSQVGLEWEERAATEIRSPQTGRIIKTDFDKVLERSITRSSDLMREPVRSIKTEVQTLLKDMRGESPDKIAKAIGERFEGYAGARAQLIADTTSAVTINSAKTEAWKGLEVRRVWLSRRDKRVRPAHRIDGHRSDERGYFALADGRKVQYPNDPRERCTVLPDVMRRQ